MKPYEEIKFQHGYIRWIREDAEYVCRLSEEVMNELKEKHEKEWIGLTPADRVACEQSAKGNYVALWAAIEAKLKEKNNG